MPQVSPGVYNETALRSLDWVLWRAAQRGLYVVLSLTDNWKYYNGIDQVGDSLCFRTAVRVRVRGTCCTTIHNTIVAAMGYYR